MDMTHGNPWGVPWDPGVGTMCAPWEGSLSLLGLRGPLGLLDPRASWALGPLGPQGLMAPQGTQGSGVMAWTIGVPTFWCWWLLTNTFFYGVNFSDTISCFTIPDVILGFCPWILSIGTHGGYHGSRGGMPWVPHRQDPQASWASGDPWASLDPRAS